MFSLTCSTRLAPVMTVDTFGFAAHQAIASCDSGSHRARSATSSAGLTFSLRAGSVSSVSQPLVARQRRRGCPRGCRRCTCRSAAPTPSGLHVVRPSPMSSYSRGVLLLARAGARTGCTAAAPRRACGGCVGRRSPTRRGSRLRSTRRCPSRAPCRTSMMSRHRPHRLLDRRRRVGAVAVEEVDEVEPDALERPVDRLHEVLAVERVAHVHALVDPPEQLGRDHVAVSLPAELGDRLAHDPLGLAAGVRLGVVEEVDAGVAGGRRQSHGEARVELVGRTSPRNRRTRR